MLKLFVSEAARNGHDKLAEQICALKGKEFYSALLEGSAKGGHDIPIEKWRGKGNNEIGPLVLNTASANHVTLTRKYFALDENAGMMAILGSAKGCNSQFYLKELQHRFPGNLGVFMRRAAESNYLPFVKSMLTLLLKTIEQNTFPVLQTILENFLEITAAAAISIKQDFKTNLSHQLYYLSFYQPAHIPLLVKGFEMWNLSISIAIVERATEISRLVMRDEMDYYQALYITEPQCQSLRYLLMMLLLKEKNHTGLPLDIWLHITNFITPIPLNANDYQFTGMRDAKACIEIQLKKAGFLQKDSPHRAHTFFNTLSQAKTCTDMKNTIAEAASAEKSALHADRFSEQVESWNMRFNG